MNIPNDEITGMRRVTSTATPYMALLRGQSDGPLESVVVLAEDEPWDTYSGYGEPIDHCRREWHRRLHCASVKRAMLVIRESGRMALVFLYEDFSVRVIETEGEQ